MNESPTYCSSSLPGSLLPKAVIGLQEVEKDLHIGKTRIKYDKMTEEGN